MAGRVHIDRAGTPVLLAGEDVSCRRGERLVFTGVDLALGSGGLLLLRGRNGSGKSSLLRILAGLLPPESGRLSWSGHDLRRDLDAHRLRLAYVGHQDAIKPELTLREDMSFWSALGAARQGERDTASAALAALGLQAWADMPCRLLSAGQRRRLALARLAVTPAQLWLLDEPLNALDDSGIEAVLSLIANHRRAGGIAVVALHGAFALSHADVLDLDRHRAPSETLA